MLTELRYVWIGVCTHSKACPTKTRPWFLQCTLGNLIWVKQRVYGSLCVSVCGYLLCELICFSFGGPRGGCGGEQRRARQEQISNMGSKNFSLIKRTLFSLTSLLLSLSNEWPVKKASLARFSRLIRYPLFPRDLNKIRHRKWSSSYLSHEMKMGGLSYDIKSKTIKKNTLNATND